MRNCGSVCFTPLPRSARRRARQPGLPKRGFQELDGSQAMPGTAYNRPDTPVHLYAFRWDTALHGPLSGPRRGDPAAGRGTLHSTMTYALDQNGRLLDVVVFHQGTWLK